MKSVISHKTCLANIRNLIYHLDIKTRFLIPIVPSGRERFRIHIFLKTKIFFFQPGFLIPIDIVSRSRHADHLYVTYI